METKIKTWRYFYCRFSQQSRAVSVVRFVERGKIFSETNRSILGKNKITFLCLKTLTAMLLSSPSLTAKTWKSFP